MREQNERRQQQRIIAARVPFELAIEVEKAAANEMLSVSCFVRRTLASAVRGQPRAAA